jgi:RING-variant domain
MNSLLPRSFDTVELTTISPNSIALCRYCLEEDHRKNLIMPCNCSGTQAFVHRACLDRWRSNDRDQPKFNKCLVCNTEYEYIIYDDNWNIYKIKVILWTCADIIVILFLSFMLIFALGVLSWFSGFCADVAYQWNTNIIFTSILVGLIEFFVLIAWIALLIITSGRDNIPVYFCITNDDWVVSIVVIIFALAGMIIGIAAFIMAINHRIKQRTEKYKQELIYTVADIGPSRCLDPRPA